MDTDNTITVEMMIELEEIDINLYRSVTLWKPLHARGVFGGQVIGQSLNAAMRTVKRLRDGNSYCTRLVIAKQRGRAIYTCELSFHRSEPSIISHQKEMPKVPPPHECFDRKEEFLKLLNDSKTPDKYKKIIEEQITQYSSFEVRVLERMKLEDWTNPMKKPAKKHLWIKIPKKLSSFPRIHQSVAAFVTDFSLLGTAMLPHGITFLSPKLRMLATIDHSVWFHEPFRVDEWFLYEMESPQAGSSRGFSTGRIFTQEGKMVLSCAQEGVFRV
ncbi:Thioesterase/thiol ester dehydrase-isomerase, partial [Rozella allomycis CSF55]